MIFHSYVSHNQRVNPIKSHSTTIFLWFFYGFPMVFLWFAQMVIFQGEPLQPLPSVHQVILHRLAAQQETLAAAIGNLRLQLFEPHVCCEG